ncbi:hypothetical protein, partial [Burkholderia pseudomallei]|uniref:hypothetical protein n=1 Tax=Burkholderia pseudomallei TaxID=28450 RepID=UPI001C8034D5
FFGRPPVKSAISFHLSKDIPTSIYRAAVRSNIAPRFRSSFPAAAPERPGSRRASPGIERGSRPLRGGPSTFSIAPGAASGIFLLC